VLLAIETSGSTGGVALLDGEALLGEVSLSTHETYSRRLIPMAEWLLARIGVTWQEIRHIAVGIGPGSFTGLRIGLAMAKGFAYSLGVPLYGIPSLDALASHVSAAPGEIVCPVLDARKSQVYGAWYRINGETGLPVPDGPPLALAPARLVSLLPAQGRIFFLGDGFVRYASIFQDALGDRVVPVPGHLAHPRAATVGFIASREVSRGKPPHDIMTLEPLYIRPSDAEIARAAREGV